MNKNVIPTLLPIFIVIGIIFLMQKTCKVIKQEETSIKEELNDTNSVIHDTLYIHDTLSVRHNVIDTVLVDHFNDTSGLISQIQFLTKYCDVLKGMSRKQDNVIDSLLYIERKMNSNLKYLEQLLANEKENTDVLSRSLRIPVIEDKTPIKVSSQAVLFELRHLPPPPPWPDYEDRFNQVRIGLGYVRSISNRISWYGKISVPVYNGPPQQPHPIIGVSWGYMLKF